MRWRLRVAIGLLLILAGCGAGSTPTPEPAESIPPPPAAPAGWISIGSFGGAAGSGLTSASFTLGEGVLALNASCSGSGTLIVIITEHSLGVDGAQAAPSAEVPCGEGGDVRTSRVELVGAFAGDVIASAFVVEGGGTIRHAAFTVSVEQPDQ